MNVIFVRHGLTAWNLAGKIQGSTDIPLAPEGVRQAQALAGQLHMDKIDKVYYSPLQRTMRMAQIMAAAHPGCQKIAEPRLAERSFGNYEGCRYTDFDYLRLWDYQQDWSGENVESIQALFRRVWSFLDELRGQQGTALLVSHGGVSVPVRYYGQEMRGVRDTNGVMLHHGEIFRFTV